MHTEARKLHIIQAVLKTDDDAVLQAIETIVSNDIKINPAKGSKTRFGDLVGTITSEEGEAMKKTIEENFEQLTRMTGNSIIADTNIYIDVMKGEKAIAEKLELFSEVYLSPIVLAELYFGAFRSASPQKHLSKILLVIRDSELLAINGSTSELFVKIKLALFAKGKPIPENDIWIAASALQYDLSLFTSDKHFNEIEGLSLLK